jgi:hypothetical protein
MRISFKLGKPLLRYGVLLCGALLAVCLVLFSVSSFLVNVLAGTSADVSIETLKAAAYYFPYSSRLQLRLAQAEIDSDSRDLSTAEAYAERAVSLSAWDYRNYLALATAEELSQDKDGAERETRLALGLAPNVKEVHWRLANLLLREGKLNESLGEFQIALDADPFLLASTLDLVWHSSSGSVDAVRAIAGATPESRLALASFLLDQKRVEAALDVFDQIDRDWRANSDKTRSFITALVSSGRPGLARSAWLQTIGAGPDNSPLIWNGSFELAPNAKLPNFDWMSLNNRYARIAIDPRIAHSGSRSLRIDFAGLDTTVLKDEIKQSLVLRPGLRYGLECYVKTERFVSPEGPRIAALDAGSNVISSSEPISDSSDWQRIYFEFTAPAARQTLPPQAGPEQNLEDAAPVAIAIIRKPQFSYDDPTRGTIWLDDFKLSEVGK